MELGTNPNASGWLLDDCHDQIKTGDVVIADFRGVPDQRFEVLADDGRGMFRVRRPDGSVSPMRPSTLLSVATRVERAAQCEHCGALPTDFTYCEHCASRNVHRPKEGLGRGDPPPCEFCHGEPVANAATWVDGQPRAAVACPRCGEVN